MKTLEIIILFILTRIYFSEACKSQSSSESTTSSPSFTYTNPSQGQILIIESQTLVLANIPFTFHILILTKQNSTFSLIIDFGDEFSDELNTTSKTIQISKTYTNVGLYRINVSIVYPFYLNETKTISVFESITSRKFHGITEIGCFKDNETSRDLNTFMDTYELSMDNNLCGDICFQQKFNFAATQEGSDCYCGNNYGKYGQGNCTMNCNRKSDQICGDELTNSIYRINYDEISISCNPKELRVNQIAYCEVNFILKNGSNSAKIYYEDTDTTIEVNATTETLKFERKMSSFGNYIIRVDIEELDIYAIEYLNVTGIVLLDCPVIVQKNVEFNFSMKFFGFEQNVTISFGDSTSTKVTNQNGLTIANKYLAYKTYERFGIYKIFAYDDDKIFNSTCYVTLDSSTLDLNDLNSVVYLLDKKLDLNDCLNNCSGKGICKQSTNDDYKCVCFENYEGNTCQTDKHKCIRKPCLNNGICNETKIISNFTDNVYYEFECTCPDRYYGTYCEKLKNDYCTNKTCSGNGFCFLNQTSEQGECKCFPLYSGVNCEIESNEIMTIKKIISTATIIAIITIMLFFSTFIILDILSIFIKKNNKVKPTKKIQITKPIYVS